MELEAVHTDLKRERIICMRVSEVVRKTQSAK
jgi:hypothetical protein